MQAHDTASHVPLVAERVWGDAATHIIALRDAGRHPTLLELPWRLRHIPEGPPYVPPPLERATTIHVPAVDNGLFANMLQVLDAALIAEATGATLAIEWTRKMSFSQFTYGEPGTDIFASLFHVDRDVQSYSAGRDHAAVPFPNRLNHLLLAPSRGLYASAPFFDRHRVAYGKALAYAFAPLPSVQKRIDSHLSLLKDRAAEAGGRLIGLHCRQVAAPVQDAQSLASSSCSDKALIDELAHELKFDDVLFVATDAVDAARTLVDAFGSRVILQDEVPRVSQATTPQHLTLPYGALSFG